MNFVSNEAKNTFRNGGYASLTVCSTQAVCLFVCLFVCQLFLSTVTCCSSTHLFLDHNVNLNCPAVFNQRLNEFKIDQMFFFLYFCVIKQIK
jgi:hypothetical protein